MEKLSTFHVEKGLSCGSVIYRFYYVKALSISNLLRDFYEMIVEFLSDHGQPKEISRKQFHLQKHQKKKNKIKSHTLKTTKYC